MNDLTDTPTLILTTLPAPDDAGLDEYHGIGGSYIVDPVTGKRVRATEPQNDEAATPTKG